MTVPDLTNIKLWIVVPQASVNYVHNPTHATPQGITGFTASGGSTSIALSDTEQRWGAYSCKVTPDTGVAANVQYDGVPIVNGTAYVFSVYIKGVAGQAMRIYIANNAGAAKATTTFTATGYWQRVQVTHTGAETASDYELWVVRDSVASTAVFYVDGWQYEVGSVATTFFSGYSKGFGTGDLEYYWQGEERNSPSVRTELTRAGGRLLDISTYAELVSIAGLGHGEWNQLFTSLSNGGAYYQQHIRTARNFSIVVDFVGNNLGEVQADKNAILEAIRPDLLEGQPLKIVYQGFNDAGAEASHPVEIICVPQPGSLADPADNPVHQRAAMNFTIPSGLLDAHFEEGKALDLKAETTMSYIAKRDGDGNWVVFDTDHYDPIIDALNGSVECIVEAPNGDIYVGGAFTNAGGEGDADYIAKWSKANQAWEAVKTGFNGQVNAITFDANGDLYVGGLFTDLGDANGDRIVKITSAGVLTSLGTGISTGGDSVVSLVIDPSTGYLYVGGKIADAGGVANTVNIAMWNGTTWSALATGLNGTVNALHFAPNGNLYIGGAFTNADGTDGDYICFWDGTAFNPIWAPNSDTGTELNAAVESIDFSSSGNLIVGGSFTNAGGVAAADYIAKWDGAKWSALGTGANLTVTEVHCPSSGGVYVVGLFTSIGGLTLTDRVAFWTNGAWQPLDIDLPGTDEIYAILTTSDGSLYLGGNFTGTAVTGILANAIETFVSVGNANTYPFIQMHGPGVLQSIINYSTGKRINFDGLTLQAGEWVNLRLDPNALKMVSSWRGNIMHYVAAGSDYGNFYLKPDLNKISVFMPSGTDANSHGMMVWSPKFWNIEGAKFI